VASSTSTDSFGKCALSKPIRIKHSVRFAPDTKEHDGQRELAKDATVFVELVFHYLKIGGMRSVDEMAAFLGKYAVAISDLEFLGLLIQRTSKLSDLLLQDPENGPVPVLPEGGGTNRLVPSIGRPNIDHLLVVLKHAVDPTSTT
jgi:hypothetical protein